MNASVIRSYFSLSILHNSVTLLTCLNTCLINTSLLIWISVVCAVKFQFFYSAVGCQSVSNHTLKENSLSQRVSSGNHSSGLSTYQMAKSKVLGIKDWGIFGVYFTILSALFPLESISHLYYHLLVSHNSDEKTNNRI